MARALLTVHEMVVFARSRGILCQGRGSAANSTVCYVLGITAVDPSKHDPLFERFVSASRNEPPDIDFDLEHERREKVIQHIYDRYGRNRAAIVGTVIRHRERSTIREVGKALGLSEDMTGRLAKGSGDRVATVAWTNWRRRKGWISPIAGSILHWNWRRRSRTSHVIWRPTSATSS
jgi:error-prone DNA polymerase